MARRGQITDPDLPRWLLTPRGGLLLPLVAIASALVVLASIVASLVIAEGTVTPVTVVVVLVALGAVVWGVADLVWWSREDRRATVRLPRDPRG